MNLVQMLNAKVTPLSQWEPPPSKKRGAPKVPIAQTSNTVRHNNSVGKYRAVLGTTWNTTDEIERKMGLRSRGSGSTMTAWFRKGLLDRRPAGNTPEYNSRKGYEWRFKE